MTFAVEAQNNDFVYMVYVRNHNENDQLGDSELQLTIVSTSGTLYEVMDNTDFNNEHYWLAGCLSFNGIQLVWNSRNNFVPTDPHVQSPNLCLP